MKGVLLVVIAVATGCDGQASRADESEPHSAAPVTADAPPPQTAAPAPPSETAAPATPASAEPAPATSAPPRPGTGLAKTKVRRPPVIVYQATWCAPCHRLSEHLTRRGVRHVNKDIDNTPGALDEMNGKLARSGRPDAQLPVMDFRGRIVVGYDPPAVDRLCDEDLAGG